MQEGRKRCRGVKPQIPQIPQMTQMTQNRLRRKRWHERLACDSARAARATNQAYSVLFWHSPANALSSICVICAICGYRVHFPAFLHS